MTIQYRAKPLNSRQKRALLRLMRDGYSRRLAAWQVGCSTAALLATARGDLRFAIALRQAAAVAEGKLLSKIRAAAAEERNWRAAAWVLERTVPARYAARKPQQFTREQISELLANFAAIVVAEVPTAEHRENILTRLSALIRKAGGQDAKEAAP